MLLNLLLLISPLLIGYAFLLQQPRLVALVNRLLGVLIYVILFVMGIGVALIDHLQQSLLTIFYYAAVSVLVILLCNFIALTLLGRLYPWRSQHRQQKLPSRLAMILESLTLCGVLVSGFLFGLSGFHWLSDIHRISEGALFILLFLIGIQLRSSGMRLRQILLNYQGMLTALVVIISSLLAGVINALLLDLPIRVGLAMASGYGWYSLSGVLLSGTSGSVIGAAAFFNDLAHELAAILLIPLLMRYNRHAALGLCGATSMDFTLPMLQRSGGIELVPAAVVQGFLLTLAGPLLMTLFTY